jgi:hypothetical protein
LSFPFLDPKNIKDKKKRRPDEEGYDATTIYIPESFLKEQTVRIIAGSIVSKYKGGHCTCVHGFDGINKDR